MNHLKILFLRPLRALPTSLVLFVLVVALLGFADAAYLTVEHYRNAIPPCTVGGCEQVLTSDYSTVFGIPVALGGVVYYFLTLALVFAYLEGKKEWALRLALFFTLFGFLASVYFLYIQAFVLGAYCLYCLGSAAVDIILFITAVFVFYRYGNRDTSSNSTIEQINN